MPKVNTLPEEIRPYAFLGLDIDCQNGESQIYCDCPFCGGERKFSIQVATSKFRCFSCNEGTETGKVEVGGNSTVFCRLFWEHCRKATNNSDYDELAEQRGLVKGNTFKERGVCKSILTGEWLVPGYSIDGVMKTLYRYATGSKKPILMPCPKLGHQLQGMETFDPKKETILLCEGYWDSDALYEALGMTKRTGGGYAATANPAVSMLADINILGIPGTLVFFESWLPLFKNKKLIFCYDSDHPKHRCTACKKLRSIYEPECECGATDVGEKIEPPAGYTGMRRAIEMVAASKEPPTEIKYVHWGDEGYDKDLPSGYDPRDALKGCATIGKRAEAVGKLFDRIREAPAEWLSNSSLTGEDDEKLNLHSLECTDYDDLLLTWRKAMRWRQTMDDVLCTMLAVAISTEQVGDQLFVQVIGDAGSGKTRFCDAMLVSKTCYALEHLTGFHSGWKGEEGEAKFSLLDRANRKTWITPEGDTLMSNPKLGEIMSQQRRIFDGKSTASYKNLDQDLTWTGLRTPWIMAGTPALLDLNQSRLGDRFIKVFLDAPEADERREILRRVGYNAIQAVVQKSEDDATTQMNPAMTVAYQKTGGYVDYLKANAEALISMVEADEEKVVDTCADFGEFTAFLRARPGDDKDSHETKELPTRLTHQFVRLAYCMAAVLNKNVVDDEVLRRVKKVALDTSSGITFNIAKTIYEHKDSAMQVPGIALAIMKNEEQTRKLLRFLRKIKAVDLFQIENPDGSKTQPKWRLSKTLFNLYERVVGKKVVAPVEVVIPDDSEEVPF